MEYFKVRDKVVNGGTYYIAFNSNGSSLNAMGKADIIRSYQEMENGAPLGTYILKKTRGEPFDLSIIDIDYELDKDDWDKLSMMAEAGQKYAQPLHDLDVLVDPIVYIGEIGYGIDMLNVKIKDATNDEYGIYLTANNMNARLDMANEANCIIA